MADETAGALVDALAVFLIVIATFCTGRTRRQVEATNSRHQSKAMLREVIEKRSRDEIAPVTIGPAHAPEPNNAPDWGASSLIALRHAE